LKKTDAKGDLYLVVKIDFPEDGWTKDEVALTNLREILTKDTPTIEATEVDDVEYESDADIEDFGVNSGDPRADSGWVDEDNEDGGGPAQCAQQ